MSANPDYDPNNPYCQLIIRLSTNGYWVATKAQYQNLGMIETPGFETQLNWSIETPFFYGAVIARF